MNLDQSRRERRRAARRLLRRRHLYHTTVYNVAAAGVNAVNTDLTLGTGETEITPRNGHATLSESYRLGGICPVGVSVTRGRFQIPRWNNFGEPTIFSANRALTPPANPQWDDYRYAPLPLPQEEEIQVQLSNNLGAATEIENCVLQLLTDDWSLNTPPGTPPIGLSQPITVILRATAAVTGVLNAWSGSTVLTFSQALLGGVWSIIGAAVQGAAAVAWRLIFPRNKLYGGRRLRPGGVIQTAIGDALNNGLDPLPLQWGELGRFHTFEFPSIETFNTAAGAQTYQCFFWMRYLGQDRSLLDAWTQGGA